MGEFQNRAIKMLKLTESEANLTDPGKRQKQFLENALRLYLAIGGRLDYVSSLMGKTSAASQFKVDREIGSLIIELSALSNLHDLDMMQAAKVELERRIAAQTL